MCALPAELATAILFTELKECLWASETENLISRESSLLSSAFQNDKRTLFLEMIEGNFIGKNLKGHREQETFIWCRQPLQSNLFIKDISMESDHSICQILQQLIHHHHAPASMKVRSNLTCTTNTQTFVDTKRGHQKSKDLLKAFKEHECKSKHCSSSTSISSSAHSNLGSALSYLHHTSKPSSIYHHYPLGYACCSFSHPPLSSSGSVACSSVLPSSTVVPSVNHLYQEQYQRCHFMLHRAFPGHSTCRMS